MKECEEVKKFQQELQDIIKVCGWNSLLGIMVKIWKHQFVTGASFNNKDSVYNVTEPICELIS